MINGQLVFSLPLFSKTHTEDQNYALPFRKRNVCLIAIKFFQNFAKQNSKHFSPTHTAIINTGTRELRQHKNQRRWVKTRT